MEKINIAEILKNCPEGMELDCTNYNGIVTFEKIIDCAYYPIKIDINYGGEHFQHTLTKYGESGNTPYNKCIIFPKGKTSWEGFQRPFKDGDVVAYQCPNYTNPSIYIHKYSQNLNTAFYVALSGDGDFKVRGKNGEALYGNDSSARFATEEEKQTLFQAIKDNGYKWNPDTKTLEKLDEPKFKDGDILTTKAGSIFILKESYENAYSYGCYVALDFEKAFIKNSERFCNKNGCRLATEEEKKEMFDAIQAKGYKWNSTTKTLEKLIIPKFKVGDKIVKKNGICSSILITGIGDKVYHSKTKSSVGILSISEQDEWELVPGKFDIITLKPFDKVLVRDKVGDVWHIQLFEKYEITDNYPYVCMGYNNSFNQCIPYEGNEHLLGTIENCSEYYHRIEIK